MEWKKNILQHLLQHPEGQAVPRKEVRETLFTLAAITEGLDRNKASLGFVDAISGLKKRGVLINGGDHFIIPDHALAKACLDRYSGAKPMKGYCPEPGCKRVIRTFGYCRPCAKRLHDAGLLTLDGRGNPIPMCTLEDCSGISYKLSLCYYHWALKQGKAPRDPVSADPNLYDWVVLERFWWGRWKGRPLTRLERIELVRLILRSGKSTHELGLQTDQPPKTLDSMVELHERAAREIGLEQPLRFCFLPYEEEEELVAA